MLLERGYKKSKPKLTPSQRRDRAAAVATLSGLGYRPVTLKTYAPDHALRFEAVDFEITLDRAYFDVPVLRPIPGG